MKWVPTRPRTRKTLAILLQSLFSLDLHRSSLVRKRRHKPVVNQHNRIILYPTLHNQIRNTSSIGKRRNVPSNLVKRHDEVFSEDTGKLGFGFVSDNHDGRVCFDSGAGKRGFLVVGNGTTRGFGDGRMDTTAETLVGGDDEEEFATTGGGFFFDGFKDFCRRGLGNDVNRRTESDRPALAAPYCFPACMALWAFESLVEAIIFMDCREWVEDYSWKTGTYFCDFLNVLDRLETELELTEGGHIPGLWRGGQYRLPRERTGCCLCLSSKHGGQDVDFGISANTRSVSASLSRFSRSRNPSILNNNN